MNAARPILLLAALPLWTSQLPAQTVAPDSGTFILTENGKTIGKERFSIQRTGSGQDMRLVATAETELQLPSGAMKMRSRLGASGAALAISAYQIEITGAVTEEIRITLKEGRFLRVTETDRGEQVREFRASSQAIFLDERVSYLYVLLASRMARDQSSVMVLMPRSGKRYSASLTSEGSEDLEIAGRTVKARRFRLEGSGRSHHVWLDSGGRLLRVDIPSSNFRAERQTLPR